MFNDNLESYDNESDLDYTELDNQNKQAYDDLCSQFIVNPIDCKVGKNGGNVWRLMCGWRELPLHTQQTFKVTAGSAWSPKAQSVLGHLLSWCDSIKSDKGYDYWLSESSLGSCMRVDKVSDRELKAAYAEAHNTYIKMAKMSGVDPKSLDRLAEFDQTLTDMQLLAGDAGY